MADFEKNHPGIAEQELWKLFLRKAEEQGLDRDFISAVGEVCAIGLNLSKYIVRFFPTFTLHDETHSANVCRWMWVLLGEQRAQLTAHEAALLLMAACCHDIGMAVSPEQEERMRLRTYPGWDEYFRQNLKDDEEYEETKGISDRMLRNFVRMRHHERIGENLRESDWPDDLFIEELDWELLLALCRSHGVELEGAELTCRGELYDLRMCAVLLRLADLLDFDAGRAPEVLFRQMSLDRPKDAESWRSAEEHQKNRTGRFREKFVNGRIPYIAQYDNPGVEQEIRKYLDWVDQELTKCRNCLSQSERWKNLDLPYKVDDEKVKRKGYAAGKFRMTMDQDKVIDLLTGENLYSDPGVFVRELLQNSVDAVLLRAKQDPGFSLEQGLIQIDTWMDDEANTWFRIRDNGTGMNEHIIQNHFLKVGNSYYTSEEFRYANRHAPKGSYTAISRFGIGILSCFMGDKEHTQLKVSTKRFDENGKSGIRLDVTGLHGYYFLCKEKKHPASEPWFPKMPSINEEDRGYRKEPGTTICVNTNLLRSGDLRSIKEILDKYVQFPEVRVTYKGPEGQKEYPTQQELMEAVYALNPEGSVKEYVHEIPDAEFGRLKEKFPYHIWEEKPTFKLRYEPLDWLSDSEKLTGVKIIVAENRPKTKPKHELDSKLSAFIKHSFINATIRYFGIEGVKLNYKLHAVSSVYSDEIPQNLWKMLNGIEFRVELNRTNLSDKESQVLEMVCAAISATQGGNSFIAHNGVFVDGHYLPGDCYGTILLRDDFLPTVNLARNEITEFPLEVACCMETGGLGYISKTDAWKLATEREYQVVLARHPSWHINEHAEYWGVGTWNEDCLSENLRLAYCKQHYMVHENNHERFIHLGIPADGLTSDFPVSMFVWSADSYLLMRGPGARTGSYNRAHPFSRWLINNRAVLAEQLPALYDSMIQTMMRCHSNREIRDTLNTILDMLRRYQGNFFHVPADLVLTEEDFQ